MAENNILMEVLNTVRGLKDSIQNFILGTADRAIRMVYVSALFIVSAVFISIAFVLLLNDYLGLSRGWSFLVSGLIIALVAFIIRGRARSRR